MKSTKGFTIVELMVVIIVIALLATLGALAWRSSRDQVVNSAKQSDVLILKNAIEKYFSDNGEYPWPSSGCNSSTYFIECAGGQLASVLVPQYISELPRNKDDSHIRYVANKSSSSYQDRYGLLMVGLGSDGNNCKTGKNMLDAWWSSMQNCDF